MNVDEYGWARRDGCPGLTEAARALRNRVSRRATDDDRPPPSTFPMTPAAREALRLERELAKQDGRARHRIVRRDGQITRERPA